MATENRTAFETVLTRQQFLVSSGAASIIVGVLLAAWVGYQWFIVGISHEVIALLAGVAVLFGVQLLVFSFMTSMLIMLHREQQVYLYQEGSP